MVVFVIFIAINFIVAWDQWPWHSYTLHVLVPVLPMLLVVTTNNLLGHLILVEIYFILSLEASTLAP